MVKAHFDKLTFRYKMLIAPAVAVIGFCFIMLMEVRNVSNALASAATQVSSVAQSVSEGTSSQAASVE